MYLKDHSFSTEVYESAVTIFERSLGYSLVTGTYTQRENRAHLGIKLKHSPFVRLTSVRATTSNWVFGHAFGNMDWVDIDPSHVGIHTRGTQAVLALPPTLFGTEYEDAEVTYEAGLQDVPQDVQDAVREIATLLEKGEISEWNCILPVHVIDVIQQYRKESI